MYEEFTDLTSDQAAAYCRGSEQQTVRGVIASELKGKTVLDVCCGNGIDAPRYDKALYLGVDVSRVLIEAAAKMHPGYAFECADATRLPYQQGQFQAAIVKSALEHVPSEDIALAILSEACRVTSGRTYVAWHTPPRNGIAESKIIEMTGHFGLPIHQNLYRRGAFTAFLAHARVSRVDRFELWEINTERCIPKAGRRD